MYYTESLKAKVVSEVLKKELTKAEANRKYGIKGHATITKWILKFSNLHYNYLLKEATIKTNEQKEEEYEKRIRNLEKLLADKEIELNDQKLRAEILEKIIELAEKDLKVSIKKNIGAQ